MEVVKTRRRINENKNEMRASILDLFYLCTSTLDMSYTYIQPLKTVIHTMKETSTIKFFKQW